MLKNDGSSFSDSGNLTSGSHPPARQEMSSTAMLKLRNRWPFTVEAVYGSRGGLQPDDELSTNHKGSSFVT